MRALLLATHNAHKTGEIRQILGASFAVTDLRAHPEVPPTQETGATLEENAILKALDASRLFDGLVLSDDSGLEVDALDGAPGVHSARYAGETATDSGNRAKLLHELSAIRSGAKEIPARFRCVMALAQKGVLLGTFEGAIEGSILEAEHGEGGFGYDPLFAPMGYCESFAQLPAELKNELSHRALALAKVQRYLAES